MTPAQIRERVIASRREQGLPDTVQGRVLEELAAEILAQEITQEAAA